MSLSTSKALQWSGLPCANWGELSRGHGKSKNCRPIDFEVQSHRGYSLRSWNNAGLNYVIISEFSETETERFEDLLREQTD